MKKDEENLLLVGRVEIDNDYDRGRQVRTYRDFQLQLKGCPKELTSDFMQAKQLFKETNHRRERLYNSAMHSIDRSCDQTVEMDISVVDIKPKVEKLPKLASKSVEQKLSRKKRDLGKIVSRLINHESPKDFPGHNTLQAKLKDQRLEVALAKGHVNYINDTMLESARHNRSHMRTEDLKYQFYSPYSNTAEEEANLPGYLNYVIDNKHKRLNDRFNAVKDTLNTKQKGFRNQIGKIERLIDDASGYTLTTKEMNATIETDGESLQQTISSPHKVTPSNRPNSVKGHQQEHEGGKEADHMSTADTNRVKFNGNVNENILVKTEAGDEYLDTNALQLYVITKTQEEAPKFLPRLLKKDMLAHRVPLSTETTPFVELAKYIAKEMYKPQQFRKSSILRQNYPHSGAPSRDSSPRNKRASSQNYPERRQSDYSVTLEAKKTQFNESHSAAYRSVNRAVRGFDRTKMKMDSKLGDIVQRMNFDREDLLSARRNIFANKHEKSAKLDLMERPGLLKLLNNSLYNKKKLVQNQVQIHKRCLDYLREGYLSKHKEEMVFLDKIKNILQKGCAVNVEKFCDILSNFTLEKLIDEPMWTLVEWFREDPQINLSEDLYKEWLNKL